MSNTLSVCAGCVVFSLTGSVSHEFFKVSSMSHTQESAASAVGLNVFSCLTPTENPSPTNQSQTGHHTFDSTNGLFGLIGEVGPWVRESRESWRYMLSW